jgi:hypothetical protein
LWKPEDFHYLRHASARRQEPLSAAVVFPPCLDCGLLRPAAACCGLREPLSSNLQDGGQRNHVGDFQAAVLRRRPLSSRLRLTAPVHSRPPWSCPSPTTPHPTRPTPPHPTPHTLHPTPYTLHPTPYTPRPAPHTLLPTPHTLLPTPHTLLPTPYSLLLTPYSLLPTPYLLCAPLKGTPHFHIPLPPFIAPSDRLPLDPTRSRHGSPPRLPATPPPAPPRSAIRDP